MSPIRPHTAAPPGPELGPRRAGKDNKTLHTNQSQTINCLFKSIKRDHQTTQDEDNQSTTYFTGFLADDNSAYRFEVTPIRLVATKPDQTDPAEPDPGLVRTKSADRPQLKRLDIDARPKVDPIKLIEFAFAEFDAVRKRGPVAFAGQPDPAGVEKAGGGTSRAQLGWGPSRPPTRLQPHNNLTAQQGTDYYLHRSTSHLRGHPSSLHLGSAPTPYGPPLKRQKLIHPQLDEPYYRPRSVLAPVNNLSHPGRQLDEIDSDEEGDGGLSKIKSKAAKSEFDLSYRYHPSAPSHSIDNNLLPPPRPESVPVRVGVGLPIFGLNGAANGHHHDNYDEDDDEHEQTTWRNPRLHAVTAYSPPLEPPHTANPILEDQTVPLNSHTFHTQPQPSPPAAPNPTEIFDKIQRRPPIPLLKPLPTKSFSRPAPAQPSSRSIAPTTGLLIARPKSAIKKPDSLSSRQVQPVTIQPASPSGQDRGVQRQDGVHPGSGRAPPPDERSQAAAELGQVTKVSKPSVASQQAPVQPNSGHRPLRLPPLPTKTGPMLDLNQLNEKLVASSKHVPAPAPATRSPAQIRLPPLPLGPTKPVKPTRPASSTTKKQPAVHPTSLPPRHNVNKRKWVTPYQLSLIDGKPPIWSMYRQELCESVEYYKSYQSGHYNSDNLTRGYLLDGFPSMRDAVSDGGRVIVSHGGGKSEDTEQGYQLKDNQTASGYRVKHLLNCKTSGYPVVMIVGEKCEAFPRLRDLGVKYAVLGFYKVTAAWTEVEPNLRPGQEGQDYVRWKFRFEWVKSQGRPWFADLIGTWPTEPAEMGEDPPLLTTDGSSAPCEACSFKVDLDPFREQVSCFNPACGNYFLLDGRQARLEQLHFRDSFLRQSTKFDTTHDTVPYQLVPESIQRSSRTGTSKENWVGFHCEDCGRLSCRKHWDHLECANCHASAGAMPTVQSSPLSKSISIRDKPKVHPRSSVTTFQIMSSHFQGHTFNLPDTAGRIHHFWSFDTDRMKQVADLFHQFQQNDVGALLKRNPMSKHKGGGGKEFLTKQFGFNAGQNYRYVVAVGQHPFKIRAGESERLGGEGDDDAPEAPDCVRSTVDLAIEFAKHHIAQPDLADELNEVLTVGYFAGQNMSFHHDGEAGLGEIVSTLSLGSPAKMEFRKRVLKGQQKPKGGHHPTALTLRLEHGDWIIMEGKEVQAKWEHAVTMIDLPASGKQGGEVVRFAATSRCIGDMHEELMTPKSSRHNSGRTTPVANSGAHTPTGAMTPVKAPARPRPQPPVVTLPAKLAEAKVESEAKAEGGAEEEEAMDEFDEWDDSAMDGGDEGEKWWARE